MTALRPRRLVHRGRVEASGLLVPEELLGAREARRRALSLWLPGTVVERLGSWLLLVPPAPVWTEASLAPGAPLVRYGKVLLAAPLDADELEALAPPEGAVVAVRGGVADVHPPGGRTREEPARWLQTTGFEVIAVESLGALPAPPAVAAPLTLDLRARLPDVLPPAAPGMEAARAALERALRGADTPAPTSSLRRWLQRLSGWLRERIRRRRGASSGQGAAAPAELPAHAPRRPSLLDRLRARIDAAIARLLHLTRLGWLVGRAQAEYLGRMVDMFERGDLQEALRHAIPLGRGAEGPTRPALGVPKPRAELSISPLREGGGSGIGVGEEVMDELRRLYRQAFQRLAREGRIGEAAFVLAELLQADDEAVAFLEQHGRQGLAAELAEARGLAPGLVVRLWFLAGDVPRAVQVARRTGAFADAVERLAKVDPAGALALRRIWAESLAEAGNFAGAVDVVWREQTLRGLAEPWLDRLLELGGTAGARALPRKLVLAPDSFPRVRGVAEELLEDDSRDRARERQALADALVKEGQTPELTTLARPLVRALVRDRGLHGVGRALVEVELLASFAQDNALRTDLPALPPPARGRRGDVVTEHRIHPHDLGTSRLHDAVALPTGRLLVALGERGVRLLTRDGRTVHHFDVPAHHLVVSEHGDRAIALATRGEATRLTRLDLLQRRASRWCDARVDVHAPDYDGSLWFVAAGDAVFAVDALAPDLRALWRVDRLEGKVLRLARSPHLLAFVTDGVPPQRWVYQLPGLVLRQRRSLESETVDPRYAEWRIGQAPGGATALIRPLQDARLDPPVLLQLVLHEDATARELILPASGAPLTPVIDAGWTAIPILGPDGVDVVVVDSTEVQARFVLAGARHLSMRIDRTLLSLADDRGRLLVYELEHDALSCDLRL